MAKTTVVVVDDSALVRSILTEIINRQPDMQCIGAASDPLAAREMIRNLNPDVITLDVEMPKMDGLDFLQRLMRLRPMPVVMVSTLTERGAEVTLKALELGAVDFVAKPKIGVADGIRALAQDITDKIRIASKAHIRRLVDGDPSFNPKEFINGAKLAYEMIVVAFADGDRKTLKNLLSREVYEGFDAAISERESKGEVVRSSFVGIEKADIVGAEVKDSEANVTLRIVSQLISATYDKAGALVEGDADTVAEVNDLWTFARDTRSRDPNWKLIATESEG